MSAEYKPVSWTRAKVFYDAVVLIGIAVYLLAYLRLGPSLQTVTLPIDDQTMRMDAYGTCAFLLLSIILCIGPLARLDRRFLPLLYNRRHLGVMTCAVAAGHVMAVLDWYFAYSPTPPVAALLNTGAGFVPFGIFGFLVLLAMAFTSHDFWLHFLGPPVWKALHMAVYFAYASIVVHIGFGALQDTRNPALPVVIMLATLSVCGLHLAAARREHRADVTTARPADALAADGPWLVAGLADDIPDDGAIVIHPAGGEAVAIFRHAGKLSAVSNVCAHQNGPLGEGRVVDGCITCPWHGYQYRLEDGCAPPPYTERIATYRLRLDGRQVLLDTRPNPPGTLVAPLEITE